MHIYIYMYNMTQPSKPNPNPENPGKLDHNPEISENLKLKNVHL